MNGVENMKEGVRTLIEPVIVFARAAHEGQKRKYTGEPYIVHPVKVMETCSLYTQDPAILAAAILHDVIEDTPAGEEEIVQFLRGKMSPRLAARTLELVVELTDVFTRENYPGLNRRERKKREFARLAKVSSDAQTIKYADITDNVSSLVEHDADFSYVFLQESKRLLEKIDKGHPVLYRGAVALVDAALAQVSHGK